MAQRPRSKTEKNNILFTPYDIISLILYINKVIAYALVALYDTSYLVIYYKNRGGLSEDSMIKALDGVKNEMLYRSVMNNPQYPAMSLER